MAVAFDETLVGCRIDQGSRQVSCVQDFVTKRRALRRDSTRWIWGSEEFARFVSSYGSFWPHCQQGSAWRKNWATISNTDFGIIQLRIICAPP